MNDFPIFEPPTPTFDMAAFDALLAWAVDHEVSDISLVPNEPVWARIHGVWGRVTRTVLSNHEIKHFVNASSRQPSASARVESGEDVDYAYEIRLGRANRHRFRVNATGCRDGHAVGVAVVMRSIPSIPKRLEDLGVEDEIRQAITPLYGLVLVTGPVGSGKSTLLAGALRYILENQPRNVLTYEEPIEFDLVGIPNRRGLVVQTEIPVGLREFSRAPRNSLRRAGDVILFGESRDPTTMRNMTIVAETGVAVYSTVHTNSVSETISRMVREFPNDERSGMAATLISALRLIVHQRLLRSSDGKRVALREYLIFDDAVRRALVEVPLEKMISAVEALVQERGQPLMVAARRELERGRLDEQAYLQLAAIREKEMQGLGA
ncbi:MAG: Flp pilus assembly complex ATPase component TadA [Halothiobacillaceae bacterium]